MTKEKKEQKHIEKVKQKVKEIKEKTKEKLSLQDIPSTGEASRAKKASRGAVDYVMNKFPTKKPFLSLGMMHFDDESRREYTKKYDELYKEYGEIEEKNKKITELTDSLQRLQAEFENYKKYVEKQKAEFVKYSKGDIISKLLPILDSFEMALKNTADKEKFIKGTELIFSQLYQLLGNEGLKPIEALAKKFDPYKHEVLLSQVSDKEEGTILEELQKGYMLGDKVIRHSKVKIAKNADKKADTAK